MNGKHARTATRRQVQIRRTASQRPSRAMLWGCTACGGTGWLPTRPVAAECPYCQGGGMARS